MALRQISLNNFRNLKDTTLNLHRQYNIFTGLNASGKSSLLEAIHILCQGRSFRTHQIDQCIQFAKNDFLLFGQFDNYKAGITRSNRKTTLRVNNETVQRVSLLAEKTPVRIINADSFDLILGSPSIKREYLDWYLFHVEHNYLELWTKHRHALKQRNALLKQKKHLAQLDYWDDLIVQYCQEIFKLRSNHLNNLNSIIRVEFKNLIDDIEVNLEFIPGWDIDKSLKELLKMKRPVDLKYGFTSYGSHRDDIRLSVQGLNAKQVLSRGQIKKICIVLLLAQISLLIRSNESKVILLFDDLSSELDRDSISLIMKKIVDINIQLFISNIETSKDLMKHFEEYKLFHVEHGMIKAVKNS